MQGTIVDGIFHMRRHTNLMAHKLAKHELTLSQPMYWNESSLLPYWLTCVVTKDINAQLIFSFKKKCSNINRSKKKL